MLCLLWRASTLDSRFSGLSGAGTGPDNESPGNTNVCTVRYIMQIESNNRSKQYVQCINHKIKKTCCSWFMASLFKVKPSKSPQAPGLRMPEAVKPDGPGSRLTRLSDLERQTGEKISVTFA